MVGKFNLTSVKLQEEKDGFKEDHLKSAAIFYPLSTHPLTVVFISSLKWGKAPERTSNPKSRQLLIRSALKQDLNPDPSFLLSHAKGLLADFSRFLLFLWFELDPGQLLRLFIVSRVVVEVRVRQKQ